jgi:phosphoribosyl-ATP pyrophosphohydrolase
MKLIGLSGRKRSGKDTVYAIIQEEAERLRPARVAFGDALKQEVADLLNVTVAELEADKVRFRGILQWWGTEWRRHQDLNYWINKTRAKILSLEGTTDLVVVTDVRFPNEAELIEELGGLVVRVSRPEADHVVDPHSSEVVMDGYPFEQVIHNTGTLEDLRRSVRKLLLVA